jgi:hypothetical protein
LPVFGKEYKPLTHLLNMMVHVSVFFPVKCPNE